MISPQDLEIPIFDCRDKIDLIIFCSFCYEIYFFKTFKFIDRIPIFDLFLSGEEEGSCETGYGRKVWLLE